MNKKILAILIVIVIVLIVGYLVYSNSNPANGPEEQINQSEDIPQVQIEVGGIGVEPGESGGTLMVCQDKCGDNVCQTTKDCTTSNLSCACLETPQDCPQDCE